MATTSTSHYLYKMPRITGTTQWENPNPWQLVWSQDSLPAIDHTPDVAWRLLKPTLTGIVAIAEGFDMRYDDFTTPARLEFVFDGPKWLRGCLIFDSRGRLIVHVLHAVLGYDWARPALSEQIALLLGVLPSTFCAVNDAVRERHTYVVVVSRQKHKVIDGVDTAYPTNEVEPTWTWWLC